MITTWEGVGGDVVTEGAPADTSVDNGDAPVGRDVLVGFAASGGAGGKEENNERAEVLAVKMCVNGK